MLIAIYYQFKGAYMMKRFGLFLLMLALLSACGSQSGISIGTKENPAVVENAAERTASVRDIQARVLAVARDAAPVSYVEDELLVKFKSGVEPALARSIHARIQANVSRKISGVLNIDVVRLPKDKSVLDAMQEYMADPLVEYAELNFIKQTKVIPNDDFFPQQWALRNNGTFAAGTAGADIKAYLAWDITTGSESIIIADIDTGIDYDHPDLITNIWTNAGETSCTDGIDNDGNGFVDDCRGWDFVNNDNDPMDDHGHGTHVAGIIGAKANNGRGIAGIMWDARIMALKAFGSDGLGNVADIISAVNYAVVKGARIINASYGGNSYSQAEYDAINAANTANILFVAAAGNEWAGTGGTNNDLSPVYPSSYNLPNIISVAATDQKDLLASFSNFGTSSVHLAAPGVYILSTLPNDGYQNKEFWPGTSMATPHVVGTAALLMTYYQDFTMQQIKDTILASVDKLPNLANYVSTGGRLNAYEAISSLLTPSDLTAASTDPGTVVLNWKDNATHEDGYRIERRISSTTTYTEIATAPANTSTFTDPTTSGGISYEYRVRAFNSIGNSVYSNEASVTTPTVSVTASGGGDGGCSVAGTQASKGFSVDMAAVLLVPVIGFILIRIRRS
jgi:subtilisin family serine protease